MKLTLNKSWELCLKEYGWIAKQIRAGDERNVAKLKKDWCEENGFENEIRANCFFCQYVAQEGLGCSYCPGTLIDKTFDCTNLEYYYSTKPLKFYAKLRKLNKKRIEESSGSRK